VSEEIVRWVVGQFREWVHPGEREPFFDSIDLLTWYREPDFARNYRALYELEKELNEGRSQRFELLSIWRLARDEGYARWAREVGPDACQITFFGMERTTDWFVRRRGAFRDNIVATERLLEVGIRPRWQLFLTTCILPELDDLVDLAGSMELERRVRDIGGEFEIFIHMPSPDGEAWNIEHLRPDVDVLSGIPAYLVEKTKVHFGAPSIEDAIGHAEQDLVPKLLGDPRPYGAEPEQRAFMVTPDLDVFSNIGDLMPWWRLGNLERDGIGEIMRGFEGDEPPGMYAHFHIPVSELAEAYGRRESRKIYDIRDLKTRLVRQWAQSRWERSV